MLNSSSSEISSCFSRASRILITAFKISFKLCGGMFVAIPTAIPDEPFTKSAGNFAGNTVGSCLMPSKFGIKSTVFFSMSVSIVSAILDILASV